MREATLEPAVDRLARMLEEALAGSGRLRSLGGADGEGREGGSTGAAAAVTGPDGRGVASGVNALAAEREGAGSVGVEAQGAGQASAVEELEARIEGLVGERDRAQDQVEDAARVLQGVVHYCVPDAVKKGMREAVEILTRGGDPSEAGKARRILEAVRRAGGWATWDESGRRVRKLVQERDDAVEGRDGLVRERTCLKRRMGEAAKLVGECMDGALTAERRSKLGQALALLAADEGGWGTRGGRRGPEDRGRRQGSAQDEDRAAGAGQEPLRGKGHAVVPGGERLRPDLVRACDVQGVPPVEEGAGGKEGVTAPPGEGGVSTAGAGGPQERGGRREARSAERLATGCS